MVLRLRSPLWLLAAIAATGVWLLLATPLALAKEGVQAKLTTPFPLQARPGQRITVAWTLTSFDQSGTRQPFNAEGVFVRLFGPTRGEPSVGFAASGAHPTGEYRAEVTVPDGGVAEIQVGIRGSTEGIIPFQDELSGIRPAGAPVPAKVTQSQPPVAPALVAGAASLLALGLLAAILRGRSLRRG